MVYKNCTFEKIIFSIGLHIHETDHHYRRRCCRLFCASNLDEKKYSITILEQNSDVLQKVKISGADDAM
jgi:hypothetical protein